jgi:hypothetical protein
MNEQYPSMRNIYYISTLLLLLCIRPATAEEGFWLPHQLQNGSAVLRDFARPVSEQPPVLALEKLQRAVVRLGDCSAAFVSATGLLITSRHCFEQALPQVKSDSIAAASLTEERPVPGMVLALQIKTQDVSVAVNRQLSTATSLQARSEILQQLRQQLLADCEQQSSLDCELHRVHNGLEYHLVQYKTLRDVRLVYYPVQQSKPAQRSWPRYDADYVLLRAYVSTTGEGNPYASDNQPYRSAFVPLSQRGVAEHDLVVAPGFTCASQRYATVAELQLHFEQLYPRAVGYLQQAIQLIERQMPVRREAEQHYATTLTELKQQSAQLEAMLLRYQHSDVLAVKQQQQQTLLHWINDSPVRQQLYGPVLNKLELLLQRQQDQLQRDLVLDYLHYAQLPSLARQLYRLVLNPQPQLAQQLHQRLLTLDSQLDTRLDMELALHFLGQYAQLPLALRLPALDQYFALSDGFNRDIVRHKLSAMYRGTSLADENRRLIWLERSAKQFEQSSDPLISFAVAIHDTAVQLEAEREQLQAELDSVRAAVMEVLMAFNDARNRDTYAESRGRLFFGLGRVSGYQPMDAVLFQPFSTLQGMQQAGVNGIAQPAMSGMAAMPVNFLSSIDSCTGYGSAPTFNASAELVGIMYAGVEENQLTDWHYDARLSRSVHVDSRFIIWQLQQSAAGKVLLTELLPLL